MKDLKDVYKAVNETIAKQALQSLEENWGDKYPVVIQSWHVEVIVSLRRK